MIKKNRNRKVNRKKGKFIVLEGGEGSGKSTLISFLKSTLDSEKYIFTREPGGSPYAEAIREIALKHELSGSASSETLFSLMWGARHDNLKNIIIPAIKAGKTVICDRFDSATYAYQVGAMKSPHLEEVFWAIRKSFLNDFCPDIYVIFDIDPKIALKRVSNRTGEVTHFDTRQIDFHNSIRKNLKKFAKKVPSKIINADQSIEEVRSDFMKIFNQVIN